MGPAWAISLYDVAPCGSDNIVNHVSANTTNNLGKFLDRAH